MSGFVKFDPRRDREMRRAEGGPSKVAKGESTGPAPAADAHHTVPTLSRLSTGVIRGGEVLPPETEREIGRIESGPAKAAKGANLVVTESGSVEPTQHSTPNFSGFGNFSRGTLAKSENPSTALTTPEQGAKPGLAAVLGDSRFTRFREVWAVDFEFIEAPGERPRPVLLVAKELRSGRSLYQWEGEFEAGPPYAIGPDSLFVAFSANAELGCHLTLGWPMPEHVLDLYVEARRIVNGKRPTKKLSLQQVLRHYGLPEVGEKAEARDLIQSGGPWSASERQQIVDYCARDSRRLSSSCHGCFPRSQRAVSLAAAATCVQ